MTSLGAQISSNRMRGCELSFEQRVFALAKYEAGCSTAEIANDLNCTQRCIQKTIRRYKDRNRVTSLPRLGSKKILSSRDRRLLSRIVKKNPFIEY
ncbi:hypothetical protein COCVIDRAFT_72488, partial [Bipolaris victoriae FI3]